MSVLRQVLRLEQQSIESLKQLWRDIYNTEPPPYNRRYLLPRLAYRLQELSLGGMKETARKKLDSFVRQLASGKTKKSALNPYPLMKGTTLVRVWQGAPHAVTVIEGGFEYQGQRYKSLSIIARTITGTHWSGPRFFGLEAPSPLKSKDKQLEQALPIAASDDEDKQLKRSLSSSDTTQHEAKGRT